MTGVFCMFLLTFITSCKKDKLIVDSEKTFLEVDHVLSNRFDNGWNLILKPDGVADIIPGGDIIYRGTYKIIGRTIKLDSPQDAKTYTFKIISKKEIKESEFGVIMRLKE